MSVQPWNQPVRTPDTRPARTPSTTIIPPRPRWFPALPNPTRWNPTSSRPAPMSLDRARANLDAARYVDTL